MTIVTYVILIKGRGEWMRTLVPQRMTAGLEKKPEGGAYHTMWREAAGYLQPPSFS